MAFTMINYWNGAYKKYSCTKTDAAGIGLKKNPSGFFDLLRVIRPEGGEEPQALRHANQTLIRPEAGEEPQALRPAKGQQTGGMRGTKFFDRSLFLFSELLKDITVEG